MLLVLLFGPTIYLISAFTENIGTYLSGLIRVGFKAYAYDVEHLDWFMDWTVFYWAWWFSWAPGFGILSHGFLAGRTLREFIFGVLMVPSLFFVLWFTVFGNGAIWVNEHLAEGALGQAVNNVGSLLFDFLSYLPYSGLTKTLALFIITLFLSSPLTLVFIRLIISQLKTKARFHLVGNLCFGVVYCQQLRLFFIFLAVLKYYNQRCCFSLYPLLC